VSASTLVVSTRAQQLDEPLPSIGPQVKRQLELIAPTTTYTLKYIDNYERGEGLRYRYLNLWQVGTINQLGNRGFLVVIPASLGLCALGGLSGTRLRSTLRDGAVNRNLGRVITAPGSAA
jgi:hypothetical protein